MDGSEENVSCRVCPLCATSFSRILENRECGLHTLGSLLDSLVIAFRRTACSTETSYFLAFSTI